ncbi:thiopeptide-type bacteriocin biosynthesis protein, partial [Nocardiopsis rhodophaea]
MPDTPEAWFQATVDFTDPTAAEHAGVHHLAPALNGLTWFLTRKSAWRCRIHLPPHAEEHPAAQARVAKRLDELAATGTINGWKQSVYEPETRAFGGEEAMDSAHTLFCADTHHTLAFLAATETGRDRRREMSLLLCRTLMRAASLDHYEQGDVWDRVAA